MRIIDQSGSIDMPYDEVFLYVGETSKFGFVSDKPFVMTAHSPLLDETGAFALGYFDTYGDALDEMDAISQCYAAGLKVYKVGTDYKDLINRKVRL